MVQGKLFLCWILAVLFAASDLGTSGLAQSTQKVELTKSAVAHYDVENDSFYNVTICRVASKSFLENSLQTEEVCICSWLPGYILYFCLIPNGLMKNDKTQAVPNDPDIWAV